MQDANIGKLKAAFSDEGAASKLSLVYNEEHCGSYEDDQIRGFCTVRQQEDVMIMTRKKPQMARRRRLSCEGTTAGQVMVNVPMAEDKWRLPVSEKIKLYGDHYGLAGEAGPEEPPAKKRRCAKTPEDAEEPAFFFQPSRVLVDELIYLAQAKAVIDLTAGAGVWALAALEKGLPYFGLVLSEHHQQLLMQHLVNNVKKMIRNPSSRLFQARLSPSFRMPRTLAVEQVKKRPASKKTENVKMKGKKQVGQGSSSSSSKGTK